MCLLKTNFFPKWLFDYLSMIFFPDTDRYGIFLLALANVTIALLYISNPRGHYFTPNAIGLCDFDDQDKLSFKSGPNPSIFITYPLPITY